MTPWFVALPFIHHMNCTKKEAYHEARFEKHTRYYVIRLEKDLLDYWVLTVINGRIKTKLGQSRLLACDSYDEAFDLFCDMAKTRNLRGYFIKTFTCDNPLLLQWI